MRLSRRTAHDATPNALTSAVSRRKASGARLLDLTVSNPTSAGLRYDVDAILDALADPRALRYEPEPFGLSSARDAVAEDLRLRGVPARSDRVVLTASTSEAYAFLFSVLCDPGDEVLVPHPGYPLFDTLAQLAGVTLVPYPLAYDGGWHVRVDALRAAIGERTRAILVVSPNNPTGSFLKRDEADAMLATGLPIVSDEVFATYPLIEDGGRLDSILQADLDRARAPVFSLGGLSKRCALPQMKAGWMVAGGPDDVVLPVLERLELVADAFLSVSTPIQLALPRLLTSSSSVEGQIRERVARNLANVRRAVTGTAASVLRVEGGWYAVVRVPRTRTEEEWVVHLVEREGVLVHPGQFFDFADEAYVVVSLLTPEDVLSEGMRRVVGAIG